MLLPTTTVGSFPKPEYLKKYRNMYQKNDISKETLISTEKKATKEIIELQEKIGLDILVDGEMYRGDMVTYFAEHLSGFKISGLVRSYGNRYYRKPIVYKKISYIEPISVPMYKFAASITEKPMKAIITGPYTLMDWSFNEYYTSRSELMSDLAHVIHQEVIELESAGAKYIQIDEPAISARPEELEMVISGFKIVTENVHAKTIVHICYGNFEKIYPKMLELPVDQLDLEMANSNYELLEQFKKHKFTKEIGLGVIDVHIRQIETQEIVKERINKALEVLNVEQIYVDPDCGLKTRTEKEAIGKLIAMVSAVKDIRKTYGFSSI